MNYDELTELRTPCYILDRAGFTHGIQAFQRALDARFPRAILGYSVKTNWLPAALGLARACGCFAEVVSHDEYRLARECGFTSEEIIYNGPMKSRETFLEAIRGSGHVNIECHREIEWLKDLPTDRVYPVGLRVSVDISRISPEDAKHDDAMSRFGFCPDNGELAHAVAAIAAIPNVSLAGLHFHRTSATRSLNFYRHLARFAANTIRELNLTLDWIDLGGGFFGIFRNAPTFQEYADVIHTELAPTVDLTRTTLILEPGNALTASAFSFVSRVIDVKAQPDCTVVVTDGSRTFVDPLFQKQRYLDTEVRRRPNAPIVPCQLITGATCLEFDRLFTLRDAPALSVDDYIIYNNVGAYTLCLSPLFINLPPTVYMRRADGTLTTVRRPWTTAQWTAANTIPE